MNKYLNRIYEIYVGCPRCGEKVPGLYGKSGASCIGCGLFDGVTKMNKPTDKELNIIRGKALVGKTSKEEVMRVFQALDDLEELCDELDLEDAFGTQGWRYMVGRE